MSVEDKGEEAQEYTALRDAVEDALRSLMDSVTGSDLYKLVKEEELAKTFGLTLVTFRQRFRYRRGGAAPHYRLGRAVYYHPDELFQWMQRHVRMPTET